MAPLRRGSARSSDTLLEEELRASLPLDLAALPDALARHSASKDAPSVDLVLADCASAAPALVQRLVAAQVPPATLLRRRFRVFVYHKCDVASAWNSSDAERRDALYRISHVRLPNVGYEAHTYLAHVARHHGDLADWTLFLQVM